MRRLLAVFLLAAAALPAGAEGVAPAGSALAVSTPALAVSTPAVALDTAPLTADQAIDRVEAADQALETLHCRFVQLMKIPGYGVDQKGEGEIWFQKERKLRVEQSTPRKQSIVSDGERIWIFTEETNQVVEQTWKAFEQNAMMSRGLAQFGSYKDLRERYAVTSSSEAGREGRPPIFTVTLMPKDPKDLPFRVELTVGPPDFLPRRTRLLLNDMTVVTELSAITANAEIDPKRFVFKAPAGATVLQMAP